MKKTNTREEMVEQDKEQCICIFNELGTTMLHHCPVHGKPKTEEPKCKCPDCNQELCDAEMKGEPRPCEPKDTCGCHCHLGGAFKECCPDCSPLPVEGWEEDFKEQLRKPKNNFSNKEESLVDYVKSLLQAEREKISKRYRTMFKDKGAINGQVIMTSHELQQFADWLEGQSEAIRID